MSNRFAMREIASAFLDLRLENEDGLDHLRDVPARSAIPTIFVGGHRRDQMDRAAGLESGADDYIAKPTGSRKPERLSARTRSKENFVLVVISSAPSSSLDFYGFKGMMIQTSGRVPWRFVRRACLSILLLLASGRPAATQATATQARSDAAAAQEPITPIPPAPLADPSVIALGDRLFHDPLLSRDGTRACSSCHDVGTNGADGRRFDVTPIGGLASFNTNTVFNAALSYRMNWEGNAKTLENAAAMSLSDPQLMASSVRAAVRAVKVDPSISRQFSAIYEHQPDPANLLNAIATYERSLVTPGSRFDLWLAGDAEAISAEEGAGYRLFKSFGCVSCHQGVNVGGNLFERTGVYHRLGSDQGMTLRVPSLRNVAVTAPYFHDGSAPTLDKAVAAMGYAQLNIRISDLQVQAIVAFLGTLTGRYQGKALTPPGRR
jgi:cytochrome c peroxidase